MQHSLLRLLRPVPLLLALLLLCAPATPQGEASVENAGKDLERDVAVAAFGLLDGLPGARLGEARDRLLADRGWRLGAGGGPGGAWIGWGEASVGVSSDHPAWGKGRLAAYEQALIRARTSFVRFQRQAVAVEVLRRYGYDDSYIDPRAGLPADRESSMREKVALLEEAKLNNALEDQGVEIPPTLLEKRTLYERILTRVTTTRAAGELEGLRPVTTMEAHDGSGASSIGVLVISSPELARLAQSIARGSGWIPPQRSGRLSSLSAQLPSEGVELLDDHGVRVLIDEHGDRALIAFGQSAPMLPPGASSTVLERRVEGAQVQARMAAEAALAQFVEDHVSYRSESEFGEALEDYRATLDRGVEEEGALASFVDRLSEETEASASVDMRGIVSLREWRATHPGTGKAIVGVVLAWSPSSADAAAASARIFRDPPPKPAPRPPAPRAGVTVGTVYDPLSAAAGCAEGVLRTGRGPSPRAARADALLEAIRSTHGVHLDVKDETRRMYEEVVKDLEVAVRAEDRTDRTLSERTSGFIERYEVLSERELPERGQWESDVCVVLTPFDIDDPRPGSPKKTVVVAPLRTTHARFQVGGSEVPVAEVTQRLENTLSSQLTAVGRFRVLDRSFSKETRAELERLTGADVAPAELGKLGRRLGADYVLVGMLHDFVVTAERRQLSLRPEEVVVHGAAVSWHWRLINIATAEIDVAGDLRLALGDDEVDALAQGRSGALLQEPVADLAASRVAGGVIDWLVPIQVAGVDGDTVFLNQSTPRLTVGEVLVIYTSGPPLTDPVTGEVLGTVEREIARVRVDRTEPQFSVAGVVSGSAQGVAHGAICRRAD